MEKTDLIKAVSQETGISDDETTKILDAFVNTIKEGLSRGERVTIAGFGTFTLAKRKARDFLNPKTGQVHNIPEKKIPFFKAGRNFRKFMI